MKMFYNVSDIDKLKQSNRELSIPNANVEELRGLVDFYRVLHANPSKVADIHNPQTSRSERSI